MVKVASRWPPGKVCSHAGFLLTGTVHKRLPLIAVMSECQQEQLIVSRLTTIYKATVSNFA